MANNLSVKSWYAEFYLGCDYGIKNGLLLDNVVITE